MTIDHAKVLNFTDALDATRAALGTKGFRTADAQLVSQLASIVAQDGPSATFAPSLDRLRLRLSTGAGDECSTLLEISGVGGLGDNAAVEGDAADKVAALKFLRHLYLGNLRGGQQLWIASMPASYIHWPHKELRLGPPFVGTLRPTVNDVVERFSDDDRKNLGIAAQEALKWSMDAQIKLAPIASGLASADAPGAALVRRWFCDESCSDDDVRRFAQRLEAGFRKIANAANSGRLVFTDHVGYRGTEFEHAEAFVTEGTKRDGPDVVYIESAFFSTQNVLTGRLNWARIVVHELSHRVVGTEDVPGRYAWEGIKPDGSSFPASEAITNAESWAFFAADCAGVLPEHSRRRALQ